MLRGILNVHHVFFNAYCSMSSAIPLGQIINGNVLTKEIKTLVKKEVDICSQRTLLPYILGQPLIYKRPCLG
jgi:hypothetical protein